jgi:hypothetical protein
MLLDRQHGESAGSDAAAAAAAAIALVGYEVVSV